MYRNEYSSELVHAYVCVALTPVILHNYATEIHLEMSEVVTVA